MQELGDGVIERRWLFLFRHLGLRLCLRLGLD
jgi:hypothetical protein